MKEFLTKYGKLRGVTSIEFHSGDIIKECKLDEYTEIETIYGTLIPQYDETEVRRKYKRSLSFYDNGNLESISFQSQTNIETSIGKLPAELALFHKNGKVKRIFPLNGKITAYWTEENEYSLAEELDINFELGNFKKKIIGISFYESGMVRSITLWPKDFISIPSTYGEIEIRIGLSLYPSGKLKSCEPRRQTLINTPIGELRAYDLGALGINGDKNSLNFDEDGVVKALVTSTDMITITGKSGQIKIYEPGLKPNNFDITIMDVVPLNVEFYLDKVKINDDEYDLKDNVFCTQKFVRKRN